MKKLLVLALVALAGCPATYTQGGKSPNQLGCQIRHCCPDPNTDCTVSNGRALTGVTATDAPANVTSIHLRSGGTITVK